MKKRIGTIGVLTAFAALALSGCQNAVGPSNGPSNTTGPTLAVALGSEALGDIDVPLAPGSGIAVAGVGLRGNPTTAQPGDIAIDVPGDVRQVLLYWEGQMTTATGDDQVTVNGTPVTGELIGGPTDFYADAWTTCYRADITALGVVAAGANTVSIAGMDYNRLCPDACTNDGAALLVVYDDGSGTQPIAVKDGLDLAFFPFAPPLNATAPVTFTFAASAADRNATLVDVAAEVTPNRPNYLELTSGGVTQRIVDPFQGSDGTDWDTHTTTVVIPAGATSLTVQAVSGQDPTSTLTGLPATIAWLTCALAIEGDATPVAAEIGDEVWEDTNMDGRQGADEPGVGGVGVHLMDCQGQILATTTTDDAGHYVFSGIAPGAYEVQFVVPEGYQFTLADQGSDDGDSDANTTTGLTACTTLGAGQSDMSWDAGIYADPVERGDEACGQGYWKTHPADWTATGYSPGDDFDTVFGTHLFDPDLTLMQAIEHGGGKQYRLGRHAVAALLSAAHPQVHYGLTIGEVIDAVQAGDASALEDFADESCPLSSTATPLTGQGKTGRSNGQ